MINRAIQRGGLHINGDKVTNDINATIRKENILDKSVVVLRSGKKKQHLILCDWTNKEDRNNNFKSYLSF